MRKLRENLVASLQGGGVPVGRVAVCYQSQKALAQTIAGLLPYPTLLINSLASFNEESGLDGVSHAIELYEPEAPGYDLCRRQRNRMQSAGCRIVSLFDWRDDYLQDDFWGITDYNILAQQLEIIKRELSKVDSFHITSELGTDITFSVRGRSWIIANGFCRNDGLAQMPDGEIYTCPVEDTFTGVIVIDGTVSRSWLPREPQRLEFKCGKLVDCSPQFAEYIKPHGPDIYLIGEFALGLNPDHRQVVRNISVDEKAAGTVHFALGDSYNLGKNKCICHVDMVVRNPRIETTPYVKLPYFESNA
ncbi:aminopeptidase [Sporomusa malonica]|uniref:Thermophilic metalloprotease (M29) n=1 Tax=Sporomusa malonica TaxID=112901 RepID=A0A1W1Y895_9FIRM|nr:aminopeptidase [Sporomusa malonica]SMC32377.1 Thermophilic metalloprotease (M29) [Sporomusa malonica]